MMVMHQYKKDCCYVKMQCALSVFLILCGCQKTHKPENPDVSIKQDKNPVICDYALVPDKDVEIKNLLVNKRTIQDINGIFKLDNYVFFATSPVYGKPGLWRFDCKTNKIEVLKKAVNIVEGYPDGADYFSLISAKRQGAYYYLRYSYVKDVDVHEFDRLKTVVYLKRIKVSHANQAK